MKGLKDIDMWGTLFGRRTHGFAEYIWMWMSLMKPVAETRYYLLYCNCQVRCHSGGTCVVPEAKAWTVGRRSIIASRPNSRTKDMTGWQRNERICLFTHILLILTNKTTRAYLLFLIIALKITQDATWRPQ